MDPTPGITAVIGNLLKIVTIFVELTGVFIAIGGFFLELVLPFVSGILMPPQPT
jgi:hypothetical protein